MRTVRFLIVAAFSLLPVSACNSTPADDGGTGGGAGAGASGGQTTGGIGGDDGSGGRATGGNGTGGKGAGGGSGGTPETCGDSRVDDGEECDDGAETADCNADCTESSCGDGKRNVAAGEECDHGEATSSCNADCTKAQCGNGVLDDLEECDDGEETADCNANCTESVCGDGIANEAADEECDDAGDSETCNADCTEVQCGDGYINEVAGEECDGEIVIQGIAITEDYCIECQRNVCGDGITYRVIMTEATAGACEAQVELCNSLFEASEDCDSGGVDTATCDYDCTNRACGDGHVNEAAGEQCDDGNTTSGDGCSYAGCQIE